VADSAATAAAIASGVVTSRGRIATTAQTDNDVRTVMEMAQSAGLRTGIVTTASITDATPASFIAHINQRFCQRPSEMVKENERLPWASTNCSNDYKSNGGQGSIAEQVATSKFDILLGGGTGYFSELIEGSSDQTVIADAEARGFIIILDRSGLATIQQKQRILGLFSPGTMPVRFRGADGGQARFLERVDGKVIWPEPYGCEHNPDFQSVPALGEMTQAALRHLDNEDGFVLMIESASIDKQSHDRRPCGQIGEVSQLLDALQIALAFQDSSPNTLILVTADHGHAAHIISEISGLASLNYATPGRFARIQTPEGSVMGVNYASNDSPMWDEHSGVQVPLYASGPNVEDLPRFIRQTDIHDISMKHLGLSNAERAD
jgi:alkaline phosphatase